MKLVKQGAKLHMKWKTPLGVKLLKADKQRRGVAAALSELEDLTNRTAKQNKNNSTLHDIITKDKKNGPTFH